MVSMNERMTIRLRDFMDRDDAWGTEEGHAVYLKLVHFVERHPGVDIFVVSLDGVSRTDSSFPRESVMEVARRYRKKLGFCIVGTTSQDLLDNWDEAAKKKEQPMVAWFAKGYRLLGPQPSTGKAKVFPFVADRFETRATDVSRTFNWKIANSSMKLKQLWEEGFILRRETGANSGGIEFVYFPAR